MSVPLVFPFSKQSLQQCFLNVFNFHKAFTQLLYCPCQQRALSFITSEMSLRGIFLKFLPSMYTYFWGAHQRHQQLNVGGIWGSYLLDFSAVVILLITSHFFKNIFSCHIALLYSCGIFFLCNDPFSSTLCPLGFCPQPIPLLCVDSLHGWCHVSLWYWLTFKCWVQSQSQQPYCRAQPETSLFPIGLRASVFSRYLQPCKSQMDSLFFSLTNLPF